MSRAHLRPAGRPTPAQRLVRAGHQRRGRRAPLARRALGVPVVLFRTTDGTAVALEDRDAHRPYPLSRGRLDGDTIVSGYSGFAYDARGRCVHVPTQDEIPVGARVPASPVHDDGVFVWAWLGDPARPGCGRRRRSAGSGRGLDDGRRRLGDRGPRRPAARELRRHHPRRRGRPVHRSPGADAARPRRWRWRSPRPRCRSPGTTRRLRSPPGTRNSSGCRPMPSTRSGRAAPSSPPVSGSTAGRCRRTSDGDQPVTFIFSHAVTPISADRTRHVWRVSRNFARGEQASKILLADLHRLLPPGADHPGDHAGRARRRRAPQGGPRQRRRGRTAGPQDPPQHGGRRGRERYPKRRRPNRGLDRAPEPVVERILPARRLRTAFDKLRAR